MSVMRVASESLLFQTIGAGRARHLATCKAPTLVPCDSFLVSRMKNTQEPGSYPNTSNVFSLGDGGEVKAENGGCLLVL